MSLPKIKKLNTKLAELINENKILLVERDELSSVLKETQKELSIYEQTFKSVQTKREELQHVLFDLKSDYTLLNKTLERAQTEIKSKEKENNSLLENLASIETKKKQLQDTIFNLERERENLNIRLKEATNQINKKEKENVIAKQKFASLEAKSNQNEITLEAVKKDLKLVKKQNDTLKKQLKSRIEARKKAANNYYQTKKALDEVINSFSFQLSHAFIQAVSRPGINTIALPYRAGKIFIRGIKNKFIAKKEKREQVIQKSEPFFVPENKQYLPSPYITKGNRAFYVLHSSLPWISNGYGTRSHGLLSALKDLDIDVVGVTRLGFPVDFTKLNLSSAPDKDLVGKVNYFRLPTNKYPYLKTPLDIYLQKYLEALLIKAQECKPSIIHACSNYANGIAANHAGKILNIPSIYECRGLWEVTRLSKEPEWEFTEEFEKAVRLETEACNNATAVIAITQALKDYLINERGVPAEKITVVPNGVDGLRFTPRPRNKQLEAKYKLQNKTVIGFVGSFVGYEGLDLLIEATAMLKAKRNDFRVLLVGDGICYNDLQKKSIEAGLSGFVHFTGRIPHDEVEEYYSLVDIAPFPRKGFLVCELVSPLKPFEAMAMEKVVVASDVSAQEEIVKNDKTGLLHKKDNATDLAHTLEKLLDNNDLRSKLAKNSRQWVLKNRDWKHSATVIKKLYNTLVNVQ